LGTLPGKVIVEHTNINPNKAAHIGHLRNAVLGDTLVRLLRYCGRTVETQNYIDDTGVQVADLVIGFIHIRKLGLVQIREIGGKFDNYCWDLYAEVTSWYEEDPAGARARDLRGTTLKHMEEGIDPEASMGRYLSDRIVKCHLATMDRIGTRYDLLPWESHILALKFWAAAFEKLKASGAIRIEEEGPRAGCWVMQMPGDTEGQAEDDKIIVRSNGTVTYVGKDIAYQLWKFGLLGADFGYRTYRTYPGGPVLWSTTAAESEPGHPAFGTATDVYNVIDVRQSYLQRVVTQGLRALGHDEQAARSHHFAYEMVALSPACARELGYGGEGDAEAGKAIEMSGRRGTGVKADDLLDALVRAAAEEVRKRSPELAAEEVAGIAERVAVGALRYFMIRFTRTSLIAFDFGEVLSFEGETGPYILYAAVRAGNILNKLADRVRFDPEDPVELFEAADWSLLGAAPVDDHWELMSLLSRFDDMAEQTLRAEEPATFARYLFTLAQRFNHFYHTFPVIQEEDDGRRAARACLTWLFREHVRLGCSLLGIEVPSRM
ncbi:MAG TPA: arginine--tRNA ligase, partial [Candidatus Saccharimonadales bacterium]|nr:arginine--tRNA ligase [Candidatus Saccharimonadales bacterium]